MKSATPPIYWFVGLAGIGKSTIVKTASAREGGRGGEFLLAERSPVAQSAACLTGGTIQQDATRNH
jgi:hypothetical protein